MPRVTDKPTPSAEWVGPEEALEIGNIGSRRDLGRYLKRGKVKRRKRGPKDGGGAGYLYRVRDLERIAQRFESGEDDEDGVQASVFEQLRKTIEILISPMQFAIESQREMVSAVLDENRQLRERQREHEAVHLEMVSVRERLLSEENSRDLEETMVLAKQQRKTQALQLAMQQFGKLFGEMKAGKLLESVTTEQFLLMKKFGNPSPEQAKLIDELLAERAKKQAQNGAHANGATPQTQEATQ